jgi:hypothetical protein
MSSVVPGDFGFGEEGVDVGVELDHEHGLPFCFFGFAGAMSLPVIVACSMQPGIPDPNPLCVGGNTFTFPAA